MFHYNFTSSRIVQLFLGVIVLNFREIANPHFCTGFHLQLNDRNLNVESMIRKNLYIIKLVMKSYKKCGFCTLLYSRRCKIKIEIFI